MEVRLVNTEMYECVHRYRNVSNVKDHVNEEGTLCYRIELLSGNVVEYPADEWSITLTISGTKRG